MSNGTIYDPTTGQYVDTSSYATPLTPTSIDTTAVPTSTDSLAAFYSSPTAAMGGAATIPQVTTNVTAGDTTSTASVLSGLSGMFTSIGTAVDQGIKVANPVTPQMLVRPGGLVYNPSTGQYVSTGMLPTAGLGGNNLMLLIVIGLIIYFMVRSPRHAGGL